MKVTGCHRATGMEKEANPLAAFLSSLFAAPWMQAQGQGGLSWWAILLIVLVIILILWWVLSAQARRRNDITPSYPHAETHAPAEPVRAAVFDVAPAPVVPDDIEKIEGIGPKIASILQAEGIITFAQLADTSTERLRQILSEANLRLADPTTWPEQARLAADGDWEGFKTLQDRLTGGRSV